MATFNRLSTTVTLGAATCLHWQPAYGQPARKANSYWCPLGKQPGRTYVLLKRSDAQTIAAAGSATLTFSTRTQTSARVSGGSVKSAALGPLYWVQGQRLLVGGQGDGNAVYLCELADRRILVEKFSDTASLNFNVRSYANSQTYLTGATGFTWQTMFNSVWNQMSMLIGSAPTLPFSPDGTPEDFRFSGQNAWAAVNEILERIGCAAAYNPLTDSFSIVQLGAAQSVTGLPGPIFDADPIESNVTDLPATVRTYFHDHEQSYGQERDTELATNWSIKSPYVSSDVATSSASAVVGTVLPLWDDLARALDEDGADTNSAARATRATERKTNVVNAWGVSREHKVYQGVQTTVLPGAQIRSVLWHHNGDGMRFSWVSHPGEPIRPDMHGGGLGLVLPDKSEILAPPDLGRKSFPNYPRLPNIVEVDDGASATGTELTANGDGLFPGNVSRWVGGSITDLEACWIRPVDLESGSSPSQANVVKLRQGDRLLGRLSGVETSGGTTKPIYLVRKGIAENQDISSGFFIITADSGGSHFVNRADVIDYVGSTNIQTAIATDSGNPEVLSVIHTLAGDLFSVTHDSGTPDAVFNVGVAENWTLQGIGQIKTRTTTDNKSEILFEPEWAELDAGQTLQPGGTATAKKLVWTGSVYDNTGDAITVEDNFNSNCLFPGEQVPVTRHSGSSKWEINGDHGLIQSAKATSTITAGGTGTADIWIGDPLAVSAVTGITVHLKSMHGGQDISNGKEILIKWDVKTGIWRVIGAECE